MFVNCNGLKQKSYNFKWFTAENLYACFNHTVCSVSVKTGTGSEPKSHDYDILWDVIVKEKHVKKMDERLKLTVVVNTV